MDGLARLGSSALAALDMSARLAPAAAEPTLAAAQAASIVLQNAIDTGAPVTFSRPGDYYFSGRITLRTGTHLHIPPGVRLWRHSAAPGVQLFQTIGTSLTTDIVINGGGAIGRVADAIATNDDGHTIILWNVDRYTITDIVARDTAGPLFSNRDGKYWLYCNNTSNGYLANLGAVGGVTEYGIGALSSDHLHFSGRNEHIRIDNVWGASDDNPVALMNRDYGAYESYNNGVATVPFVNGSCRFFHITRVNYRNSAELIRLTGRFMPSVRVADLDTGGTAPGADVTGVAWTAATRQVSKTGMFSAYTWQDGDYLLVTAGTGVKQAGPGGEPSANDVTTTQPLALPIVRKIDNNSVEVGVIVAAGNIASMTVVNAAYTSEEVSDILIDGVTGSVKPNNSALGIGLDDTADPGGSPVLLTQAVHRRVVIRNVSVTVPSAGYALIQSRAIGLRELTLDGVMELAPGSDPSALLYNNTSARTVMSLFDASRATWRARPSGTANFSLFTFEPSARVLKVGSFDVVSAQTGGGVTLVNLAGDDGIVGRVDDFTAGDLRMHATASGSLLRGIVLYNGDGFQVRRGLINSVEMIDGASAINGALNSGATAGVRSRFHVGQLRVMGAVGEMVVRAQADVTYDSLIRDTSSGELARGAAGDSNAAPSLQPGNTLTFTLSSADFTAAALTQTLTLSALARYAGYHLPRAASVVNVRAEVVTAWAGGTISAATVDVGISGAETRFVSALNAFATGGTLATPSAANAYFAESAGWPALTVRLNTTGGNVNTATAGLVKITFTFE
jgi:hypothetical protein